MTADQWQSAEDREFRANVKTIAEGMNELASLSRFVRKWVPWLIAFIGVAYPTVGKLIQQVPLPH